MTDQTPQPEKRKRGAPKGNLNALKHGLYVEYGTIRNTTPIERTQLTDCVSLIAYMKHYIKVTYQKGLKANSINEVNETMRTMSMAVMALSRIINSHNASISVSLPEKLRKKSHLTGEDILKYYKNKLDDLADIIDSPDDFDLDLLQEDISDQPENN